MHELTQLIRQDMKPALGVTEPGAIAFAAATARRHTHGAVQRITLRLNSGMFKNAFTCGIPGSDEVGNAHAAAQVRDHPRRVHRRRLRGLLRGW